MAIATTTSAVKKCATCEFFIGEKGVISGGRGVQHILNGYGTCSLQRNKQVQVNAVCNKYQKWSALK